MNLSLFRISPKLKRPTGGSFMGGTTKDCSRGGDDGAVARAKFGNCIIRCHVSTLFLVSIQYDHNNIVTII
jgi:hypothetical protein